jgi:hypothetical protein
MIRKLALLAALAALVALVVPASSMASMFPAGHKFSITGAGKLGTSLGSCTITQTSGTIPSAPANETETSIPIATPTVGTCSSGASATLGGEWKLLTNTATGSGSFMVALGGPAATVTMRFSSLPGCKLTQTTPGMSLFGLWSNGATAPTLLASGYHPHMAIALTWFNDGSSCALAGKTETTAWTSETGTSLVWGTEMTVSDTTNPSSVVILGAKK